MTLWIVIHALLATLAIVLGAINLASVKGNTRHRLIGWIWVVIMLVVIFSSFNIQALRPGNYSWIHLLSVWTLASMIYAMVAARLHRIRAHKYAMLSTMAGAVIAGLYALMPGRFIANHLF